MTNEPTITIDLSNPDTFAGAYYRIIHDCEVYHLEGMGAACGCDRNGAWSGPHSADEVDDALSPYLGGWSLFGALVGRVQEDWLIRIETNGDVGYIAVAGNETQISQGEHHDLRVAFLLAALRTMAKEKGVELEVIGE